MRRTFVSLLLALGLAACAIEPSQPLGQACAPRAVAEVPLRNVRNFLMVPLAVNGREALFVVDTGAEASTITPQAVAALGLPRDGNHSTTLQGIAGSVRTHNALVSRLGIGTLVLNDVSFGVGAMPAFPGQQPPVIGLLGADILSDYDVELDLPHGRMAFYEVRDCTVLAPLPGATSVPIARTPTGLVFVDAIVDGRRVRALLDTGARVTLLTRHTAAALGISEAALADDPTRLGRGIGNGGIMIRQHRFAEIGLPGALDRNMPADVAELHLRNIDMLLGADYLGPRMTWISYGTNRLFLR